MTSVTIRVDAVDQAGEARRRAADLGARLRLDETTAGRLAIVVTECANNLWKHAGGGEIVISGCSSRDTCINVLALDKGPGMADVGRCFQDGYSTAGSSGTGLGAVKRLSDVCDLYTAPGKGVALLARVRKRGTENSNFSLEIGGISVPKEGESECGDGFAISPGRHGGTVMVVDGLGHGPIAADCAEAAVAAFTAHPP